jgi:hypothetical protein
MDLEGWQFVTTVITIIGSGFSAWVGVRVALAHIEGRLNEHDRDIASLDKKIERLEDPYFRKREL